MLPVEKAVARIAALGFEAVDFWPSNFKCPHLDEIATRLGPSGLSDLLQRYKLRLCAFTMYSNPYEKYAQLLGAAGGGLVIRESKFGKVEPGNLTSEMRGLMERVKPWLELAGKNNSYIAVENHGDALLNSVDSFRAFLDLAQDPRLGIALAPYHLQAAGVSVERVIEMIGPKLLFFYAWQNAPGLKQLPGLGPTDFTPWLGALKKIGFQGWVNPFMHGEPAEEEMAAALATSKSYLETCLTRIQ
jgi:sugar phosphate isomerase/epimerase